MIIKNKYMGVLGILLLLAIPVSGASRLQVKGYTVGIQVIEGNNSGNGIDARLQDFSQLKRPPFSAYRTYILHDSVSRDILLPGSTAIKLTGNRKLVVNLKGHDREKNAYSITVEIDTNRYDVTCRSGETVFIAGPRGKNSLLVIGISVR